MLSQHRTRLIVSSMDLSIQFWNINDGTNILQFQPQLYSTALAHQFAALPKSVCAINYIVYTPDDSRNEKLEVLFGDADAKKAKRFVLLGTETGGICGYQEVYANIDSVPLFFMQQHNISQEKVQETKEAVKKSNFMDLVEYMMHSKSNDYDQDRRMSTGLDSKKGFGDALVVKKDDVSKKKTGLSLRNDLTYNSVLWLHYLENSRQLLVSYSHGQVSFWDFEKHIMMRNLVLHPTGPILVGMRKKGSKGSSETANDTNDATASGTATANAVSMTLSLPTGPRKTGISRRKASISAMSMAHITALNSQRAANHSILPTYTETVHDNDQDKSSSSDSESQVKQDTVWQPSSYQSTILASHGRKYRELTGLISGQNDRKTSMTRGGSDENNNIHGEIRRNRIQSSDILSESDDCSDKIDAIRLPAVPNYNRRDSASIVHQSLATNKASIIVPALTNRKHRPTFVMNLSNRYGKAGIQANSNTTSSTHIPATMLSLSSKSDDNASNSISKSVVNPEAISSPAKTNRNLLTRKDSVAHSDSDSDSDDTDIGTGMGSNGMKDDDSLASESSQLSVEKTTGQAKPLPPVVLESAVILKETNVLIGKSFFHTIFLL